MKVDRPKVVMSDALKAVREECARTGRGFSNRLTEIVERYGALLEHYSPRDKFDESEWARLCGWLRAYWPRPDTAPTPEHLAELLEQADEHDLADMVGELELVETTALLEEVWRDLAASTYRQCGSVEFRRAGEDAAPPLPTSLPASAPNAQDASEEAKRWLEEYGEKLGPDPKRVRSLKWAEEPQGRTAKLMKRLGYAVTTVFDKESEK